MNTTPTTVSVRIDDSNYRTASQIRGGEHTLLADEPVDLGGNDAGPTPVEMLLSAIGSCKAITARMYAQRKGWPMTGLGIEVTHAKAKPTDDAGKPIDGPPVDQITVRLSPEGDLTDQQRARIAEIATLCPVSKMVKNTTSVRTELAGQPA